MPLRVLSIGVLAGLLMNICRWLGNQLSLGREWDVAIARVVPWLVAIATPLLALAIMVPVTVFVWRRVARLHAGNSAPAVS